MFMVIIFAIKSYDPEEMLDKNSKKPKLEAMRKRPMTKMKRR
jgi:hypothetical protein